MGGQPYFFPFFKGRSRIYFGKKTRTQELYSLAYELVLPLSAVFKLP